MQENNEDIEVFRVLKVETNQNDKITYLFLIFILEIILLVDIFPYYYIIQGMYSSIDIKIGHAEEKMLFYFLIVVGTKISSDVFVIITTVHSIKKIHFKSAKNHKGAVMIHFQQVQIFNDT